MIAAFRALAVGILEAEAEAALRKAEKKKAASKKKGKETKKK